MTPNVWFKRVRAVLRLTRHDVAEIMRLGGETVTSSQTDGWARRDDDDRAVVMSAEQFDRFTLGLVEWSRGRSAPRD